MKLDRGVLKSLPKVLLHEHLDGVLRPKTVIELARTVNYDQLPTEDPRRTGAMVPPGGEPGKPAQIPGGICAHHRRDAKRRGAGASGV